MNTESTSEHARSREMRAIVPLVAMCFACAVIVYVDRACAQDLVVDPPGDACLNADTLRERVDHWLGGRTIDPALRVEVHALTVPPWFSLRRPDGSEAERRFESLPTSCTDRLNAIALAIAIALEQPVEPTDLEAQTPSVPPPEPALIMPTDTPSEREIARHDRVRILVAGLLLVETLPVAAFGIGAGVEAPISSFVRLHISGVFAPSTQVPIGDTTADAQFIGGRVLFCGDLIHGHAVLEACAGAIAGLVRATGIDHALNQTSLVASTAILGRIAFRWPAASTVSLRLALDGALNVIRPRLLVRSVQDVSSDVGVLGMATSLEGIVTL